MSELQVAQVENGKFAVIGPAGQIGFSYSTEIAAARFLEQIVREGGLDCDGRPRRRSKRVRGWSVTNA